MNEHNSNECIFCKEAEIVKYLKESNSFAILKKAKKAHEIVDKCVEALNKAGIKKPKKTYPPVPPHLMDMMACDEMIGWLKHVAYMTEIEEGVTK